jgi:hypothetical protein
MEHDSIHDQRKMHRGGMTMPKFAQMPFTVMPGHGERQVSAGREIASLRSQ